jgi:hypothetical protein
LLEAKEDWRQWHDRLIFREEQRAIGEAMIASGSTPRVVIGYGAFCKLFGQSRYESGLWALRVARNFLLNLEQTKDFRRERIEMMRGDLRAIIEALRPEMVEQHWTAAQPQVPEVNA